MLIRINFLKLSDFFKIVTTDIVLSKHTLHYLVTSALRCLSEFTVDILVSLLYSISEVNQSSTAVLGVFSVSSSSVSPQISSSSRVLPRKN